MVAHKFSPYAASLVLSCLNVGFFLILSSTGTLNIHILLYSFCIRSTSNVLSTCLLCAHHHVCHQLSTNLRPEYCGHEIVANRLVGQQLRQWFVCPCLISEYLCLAQAPDSGFLGTETLGNRIDGRSSWVPATPMSKLDLSSQPQDAGSDQPWPFLLKAFRKSISEHKSFLYLFLSPLIVCLSNK